MSTHLDGMMRRMAISMLGWLSALVGSSPSPFNINVQVTQPAAGPDWPIFVAAAVTAVGTIVLAIVGARSFTETRRVATATENLALATTATLDFGREQAELAHGCKLEMALTSDLKYNYSEVDPVIGANMHVHVTNHGPGLASLVEYVFERGPWIHSWAYEPILAKGNGIDIVERVPAEAIKDVPCGADVVPVFGRWVRWTDELGGRWEWAHPPGPRPATTRQLDPSEPWSRLSGATDS